MFCKNCGKEIEEDVKFCPECGTAQEKAESVAMENGNQGLSGSLGIHRFYVGKVGTGILQILLTCCFGLGCIWALIDFIIILCGNFTDKAGLRITNWDAKY